MRATAENIEKIAEEVKEVLIKEVLIKYASIEISDIRLVLDKAYYLIDTDRFMQALSKLDTKK